MNCYYKDKQNLDHSSFVFELKKTNQHEIQKNRFQSLIAESPRKIEAIKKGSESHLDNNSWLQNIDFNAGEEMLL